MKDGIKGKKEIDVNDERTWQTETAEEVVVVLLDADADAVVLARVVSAEVRRPAELVHIDRLAARTLETRLEIAIDCCSFSCLWLFITINIKS